MSRPFKDEVYSPYCAADNLLRQLLLSFNDNFMNAYTNSVYTLLLSCLSFYKLTKIQLTARIWKVCILILIKNINFNLIIIYGKSLIFEIVAYKPLN